MTNNYRIMICFPNRIDDAIDIAGGAWLESLPLPNLQDRAFGRVARSINAQESSTKFTIDLGRQRSIRLFALIAHNISLGGRYHIEASNNADLSAPVLDEFVDAWGVAVGGAWDIDTLEWENDNWWLGGYTAEDIEGQTPVSAKILDEAVLARYWRISIIDAGNPAGFVQIGRIFIGDSFLQPTINYAYGAGLGYEDDTGVEKSLGGAEFFDPREPIRVMRFQLTYMSDVEGFSKALELTRRAGISAEVFIIADPTDTLFGSQRNFVGRLRTLSPLEQAMFQLNSMSFEIKELR